MHRYRIDAALAVIALTLAACGGDAGGASSGTCDWSQDPARMSCLEQSGNPMDIANQREVCEANDGTWTSEPCPVNADLIGCCTYDLGLEFRECFYTRSDRPYDPETTCTGTTFNGVPGVWTPAPPG